MASVKEMRTKAGAVFYRITVSRGRGTAYTKRWYPAETWSAKTIQRELNRAAAEFERACKAGEVENRKQAKEREAREQAERAKLRTFRDYAIGVFMATKETLLSENARASYQMNLEKHIIPVLGDFLLSEISPAMIQSLLLDFQKTHSLASTVKCYNIIKGVFDMAFLDGSIELSPMLKVKRPSQHKAVEQQRALTLDELHRVLAVMASEPLQWRAFVALAIDTGARRGELCGLKWADIQWAKGIITLQRNLQYTPGKGIYVTTPKNGLSRTIDVGIETLGLLRALREEQAQHCISEWVFSQRGSMEPMHPQSPDRYFTKIGKKCGIEHFHPHMMRHTSASLAITNGADVVSVSERLGHSDTAVTLRMYAHASDESVRRAGQIVRDAIGNVSNT